MSHQTPFSKALPFHHLKWKCPRWDSLRFCSRDFNCIERVLSVTANKIKDLIIRGNIWRANVKELLFMTHTVWVILYKLLRLQSGRHDDLESKKPPGWEASVFEVKLTFKVRRVTPLGSFQIILILFFKYKTLSDHVIQHWYHDTGHACIDGVVERTHLTWNIWLEGLRTKIFDRSTDRYIESVQTNKLPVEILVIKIPLLVQRL